MGLPSVAAERELTRPGDCKSPAGTLPSATSPALWGGAKGMVPPPQPTRKRVAKTKTLILIMKFLSCIGMGTGEPIPYGQKKMLGPKNETRSAMPGQTKDPVK